MLTIYRNQDGGAGGGTGGAAPGGAGGSQANGDAGAAAPSYLDTKAFDSFRGELDGRFSQFEQGINELREHLTRGGQREDSRPRGSDDPTEPNPEDPKYARGPEGFKQYQRDMFKYLNHVERSEAQVQESQQAQLQAIEDRIATAHEGHAERMAAIPDFSQRMRGANLGIKDNTALGLAILESEFSPHILLHLRENPEVLNSIKKTARDSGAEAAIRRIGRLENKFESEQSTVKSKTTSAGARPTRGGFPGGNGGASSRKTEKELRQIYGAI